MITPRARIRTLMLLGALAASAFACKGRPGSEPGGEHAAVPSSAASATPTPALWEPVDKQFTGCEGG